MRTKNCPNPACWGGTAEIGGEYLEGPPYFVFCQDCHMQGPQADTKTEARELWNQLPREHPETEKALKLLAEHKKSEKIARDLARECDI